MYVALYDDPTYTRLVRDLTPDVVGGSIAHGVHGDEDATIQLRIPMDTAAQLFRATRTPALICMEGGQTVYVGRVESVEIGAGQTTLTAYGYWRALSDARYTALWSHAGTADWRPVRTSENPGCAPDRFTFDTNNRLYIAPNKGAVIGATVTDQYIGALAYRAPHNSSRTLTTLSFSYDVVALSTDWYLYVHGIASAPGNAAWHIVFYTPILGGSGTGTASVTLPSGIVAVVIGWFQIPGSNPNPLTAETGTHRAICTQVRVTSKAPPVRASDIAAHIVDVVAALNPAQVRNSTARIVQTSIDHYEAIYEDADPRDILVNLAKTEGNWLVGVDRERYLYLHPQGTNARTWLIEHADLRLTRALDDVRNSVYAVYQESDGYALRTPVVTDANSVARYGVTRQGAVDANQTTSLTQATAIRNAYLADNALPPPRASITIPRGGVATPAGGGVDGWMIEAGDVVQVRNLPPDIALTLDQLASFRVGRRVYDLMTGVTTIEPLNPPDTLPVLLAQRANANRAV